MTLPAESDTARPFLVLVSEEEDGWHWLVQTPNRRSWHGVCESEFRAVLRAGAQMMSVVLEADGTSTG